MNINDMILEEIDRLVDMIDELVRTGIFTEDEMKVLAYNRNKLKGDCIE